MHRFRHPRRHFLQRAAGLGAFLALGADVAEAQAAPRALHILCTGPAGSIPDLIARRVAVQLASAYPAGVVVDNRPGAAGRIAVNALMQAPADGSALLLAQGAVATVYPYLFTKPGYDPAVDLRPLTLAAEATLGLALGPAVPQEVRDVAGLLAWMRRHPALANYGSPGAGTLPHLLGAALFAGAQLDCQHVAYAGGPPALAALMGGQLSSLILPEGLLREHHATGRLRVIATSGASRSTYLPQVPSFAEQGYKELVMREWFAFFMPGRTPAAVLDDTSSLVQAAVRSPQVGASLAAAGMTAVASTPRALAEQIAVEQGEWQRSLRASGIKVE